MKATLYSPCITGFSQRNSPGWGSAGSGDLNGDGHLDVDDLKAIIDILISGMPAPIEADCNHDGRVDVDDVTTLINMLLNGTLN